VIEPIAHVPCWYVVLAVAWAACQGLRGIVEQSLNPTVKCWKPWQKVVVLYIHDFFYRFVCTVAGFAALYVSYLIVTSADLRHLTSEAVLLLALSFIVGVIGVGGQLHYVVLMGRYPWPKGD
jgi:hypothetical protein